jgi:P-type Ca2+ transporter type 2C
MSTAGDGSGRSERDVLWHSVPLQNVASLLNTDPVSGLSTSEASRRLEQHGSNSLPDERQVTPLRILLDQFKTSMTLLLVAAAGVALIIGDLLEAAAIVVVLFLNAGLGFANEYRAERSLQALKALVVPRAEAIRDGKAIEIPAADLVPGDVIIVDAGDRVPADARLTETWSLSVDESLLTGESVAEVKDARAAIDPHTPLADRMTMIYSGTSVVQGRAHAVVIATGIDTEIGAISRMIQTTEPERTPLQVRLDRLGRVLAVAAVLVAAIVGAAGILRGEPVLPMLETALALAIAAVPEGLPAVVTVALALGVFRMARRRAIIRKLTAVETLGSTDIICSDKTGTLTENQMTVREVRLPGRTFEVTGAGYAPDGDFLEHSSPVIAGTDHSLKLLLHGAVLCNHATLSQQPEGWTVNGDPTEGSLVVLAAKAGFDAESLRERYPLANETPFDSQNMRMATTHSVGSTELAPPFVSPSGSITFVKGAPETVLPACWAALDKGEIVPLTQPLRDQIQRDNVEMAEGALRVLAIAAKSPEREGHDPFSDLVFLGLVGMIDPPRPEAREAIQACHDAGIRVVMLTGDQPATATAIGKEIGLLHGDFSDDNPASVVQGTEIENADDRTLEEIVRRTRIYARTLPHQKLRVVRALQSLGWTVAVTGDGVNDAPALKAADIGVAMGRIGTDVARQASDMVLADDNFTTIVGAIEEGRLVFANVRKFVHYLFSCNLSEILTMFVAILVGWPLPLLPLQILWLNLVTDVFPALALTREEAESGLMWQSPDSHRSRSLTSDIDSMIVQGALLGAGTLGAFAWALSVSDEVERAVTVAFLTLGFAQLFHIFNSRFHTGSAFSRRVFRNGALWGALLLTGVLQVMAVTVPGLTNVLNTVTPTLEEFAVVLGASLAPAFLIELYKVVRPRE